MRKKKAIAKAEMHLQNKQHDFEYFDEVAFAEMMRLVIEHIEKLPVNMRSILKEYYIKGKKCKDIANELSTTPDVVHM